MSKTIPPSLNLSVKAVSTGRLRPAQRNARLHPPEQIRQLAQSIKAFGFITPILVDKDNRIRAGHGRFLAAKQLALPQVPVIRIEHLTDAQATAFQIADNRLTDLSHFDDQILAETLKELSELDLTFNLEAIGFSTAEIDLRIEGLSIESDKPDAADSIPELSDQPAVSRLGDLWQLGSHRVFCGDSRELSAFDALMGGTKANVVFTDPPRALAAADHAPGYGKVEHQEFEMGGGHTVSDNYTAFLTTSAKLAAQYSTDGSIHFWCMHWRRVSELLAAGSLAYSELKDTCVWTRSRDGTGSLYRNAHEFVLVFKTGTAEHCNNIKRGRNGRDRTNVWSFAHGKRPRRRGDAGQRLALYSTAKPVALIEDALLDCSNPGDTVLDPFLGVGSTLIAAQRVGRACRGIEIDSGCLDLTIRRWQHHTGEFAIHAISGQRFDDILPTVSAEP